LKKYSVGLFLKPLNSMSDKSIAHNIKIFRDLKNITAKEMAAHLGISYTAYNQYETGETEPKVSVIKK
jgi:transcriptional regulator with XRE-family HTH domain